MHALTACGGATRIWNQLHVLRKRGLWIYSHNVAIDVLYEKFSMPKECHVETAALTHHLTMQALTSCCGGAARIRNNLRVLLNGSRLDCPSNQIPSHSIDAVDQTFTVVVQQAHRRGMCFYFFLAQIGNQPTLNTHDVRKRKVDETTISRLSWAKRESQRRGGRKLKRQVQRKARKRSIEGFLQTKMEDTKIGHVGFIRNRHIRNDLSVWIAG